MNLPIVYRWADGSFVELSSVDLPGRGATLNLVFADGRLYQISLALDRSAVRVRRDFEVERKICGLFLDLGIVPSDEGFLFRNKWDATIPFFVSEDQWNKRFELARHKIFYNAMNEKVFGAISDYLGRIRELSTWYEVDNRWHSLWRVSSGGKIRTLGCTHGKEVVTFEDAVDAVLRKNNILPESARADWEKEKAERGVFLIPTPEEVEVFRILDEPLPFFLPQPQRQEWFEARGVWSSEKT